MLNPANENRINRRPDKAFTPHPAVSLTSVIRNKAASVH
ncbi:hypothetical protein AD00_4609 [Escherichia coli 2-316-03_S4_C2]|nr:hypothetical protein AD00_4609 [Escherichia coli 2-316-03_S4_C2]